MGIFKKYKFNNEDVYHILEKSDKHTYVELGIIDSAFCVDVLWADEVNEIWEVYEVKNITGNGVHTFLGYTFNSEGE